MNNQILQNKLHDVHGRESPDIMGSLELRKGRVHSQILADLEQIFNMSAWQVRWNGNVLHDRNGPTIELSTVTAAAQDEIEAIVLATAEENAPKVKKLLKFRQASTRCNFPHFVAAGVAS